MSVRLIGSIMLGVGVLLVAFGILGTQEWGQGVLSSITGHYSDKVMWFIIGGAALAIGGWSISRSQ